METPAPILLAELVKRIGEHLGFEPKEEVQASESAWVDVVWFDKRLSPETLGFKGLSLRRAPVLPLVGFKIELSTANNAKHVKGSVSNLSNLGALVGVLVIGTASINSFRANRKLLSAKSDAEMEKILIERVYRWIYAESQPSIRVVIMTEREVREWAGRLGISQ